MPTIDEFYQKVANLNIETRAFINGQYVDAQSGKTFDRVSPMDGKVYASIASCDASDVDTAVAIAKERYDQGVWRHLPFAERAEILKKVGQLIRDNVDEMALLEVLDVGKTYANAHAEIIKGSKTYNYYGEWADKLYDQSAPSDGLNEAILKRVPLGVVGAIVPWNYPLVITSWKVAPALLAGNSVILKPAEQSSLGAIYLAKLIKQAGVPDGVFQVITGMGEDTGKPMALHHDINAIGFTGSTDVGKLMMQYAGQSNMKRLGLECGGKSAQVVFPDANLDYAAQQIAWSIYYNQGQTCHAGSRLVVHSSVKDILIDKIKAFVTDNIPYGHPFDENAKAAAIIEQSQMEKILNHIENAKREGGKVVFGGKRILQETGGFYIEPTIIDNMKNSNKECREEIFGPVLSVITFETEAEALAIANDTPYGLGASVWTKDMAVGKRMTNALVAGTVWWNEYDKSGLFTPFGGFKQSGHGRDRSHLAYEKYTDIKVVWTNFDN